MSQNDKERQATDQSRKPENPIIPEAHMEIKFKLNKAQFEVLQALLQLPQNAGHSPSEACRLIVVQALISAKQQMVISELTKEDPVPIVERGVGQQGI